MRFLTRSFMVLPGSFRGSSHLSVPATTPAYLWCTFSFRWVFFLQPQFFLQSMSCRTFQAVFMGSLYNSSTLPFLWSPSILMLELGRFTSQISSSCPVASGQSPCPLTLSFFWHVPDGSSRCSLKYWECISSYPMDLLGAPGSGLEVVDRGLGIAA